jgi:hypothetical protein
VARTTKKALPTMVNHTMVLTWFSIGTCTINTAGHGGSKGGREGGPGSYDCA